MYLTRQNIMALNEIILKLNGEESEENKSRLVLGYLSSRFDETLENLALDIVVDAISSGNESPLQRAILDSGLCEKMGIYVNNSRLRNNIIVEFCNVKDGKIEELEALFKKTLSDIVSSGINREHLEASMNHFEFTLRERDMGGLPLGIAYNISIFDTWLYGADPTLPLEFSEDFKKLRSLLQGDYFENTIKKYILENEKCARVIMRPSSTLGERRRKLEEEKLLEERKKLTARDIEKIKREGEALSLWQNTLDSEEALASLPTLEIKDIPSEVEPTPIEVSEDGRLIRHAMKTGGISYTELFFDASDTDEDEIFVLPLLSAMLKSSGTRDIEAFSFQNLIKRELGSVSVAPLVFKKDGESRVFIKLGISLLDTKKKEYIDILGKLLYETKLQDKFTLSNIVRQTKMMLMTGFSSSGNAYGVRRAMAYRDSAYALREKISGYEFYSKIKDIEANLENELDTLIERINRIRDKIFSKERLVLSLAGDADSAFEEAILNSLKDGGARPEASSVKPLGERDEGIAIPAQVGFGIMSSRLSDIGKSATGSMLVAKMILNFESLWCEVRVKGGAYGVSLRISNDGGVGYSSYRDPTPELSLGVFTKAPAFLREFAKGACEFKKYIIGAMGEFEPYLSTPLKASLSTSNYLSGHTPEKRAKLRAEILATDKDALLEAADILEKLNVTLSSLLIAPKEKISAETVLYV